MIEFRRGARLLAEAGGLRGIGGELRAQDLERHAAVEPCVFGRIYLAIPPAPISETMR